jgi:hypothetical protein
VKKGCITSEAIANRNKHPGGIRKLFCSRSCLSNLFFFFAGSRKEVDLLFVLSPAGASVFGHASTGSRIVRGFLQRFIAGNSIDLADQLLLKDKRKEKSMMGRKRRKRELKTEVTPYSDLVPWLFLV